MVHSGGVQVGCVSLQSRLFLENTYVKRAGSTGLSGNVTILTPRLSGRTLISGDSFLLLTTSPTARRSFIPRLPDSLQKWVQAYQRLSVSRPPPTTHPASNSNRPTGKLFSNREMRLLMLGLDAAGKTSMSSTALPSTIRSTVNSHLVQTQTRPICHNNSHWFVYSHVNEY
jgi:hypothetical protein